jgi:S-adenosylmethionine-diacylglycerol 3-amino-3-carboxypropyl transferase
MNSEAALPDSEASVPRSPASWVREAARRPIAFALVREDATLDQWVVEQLPDGAEVLMVASGGCTAAFLATMPKVSRLHLVDPNPAQIALTRLKLRLLATASPPERLSILGHAPMPAARRAVALMRELEALKLSADVLGPVEKVSEEGPDQAGRYEILFARLREALDGARTELTGLLQLSDTAEQSRRVSPETTLGGLLDEAFDSVLSLPNLVGLFGEAATNNRREPFSRHFARQTRHVLATLPAATNPYLCQMLQGRFSDGAVPPWLRVPAPIRIPEVHWTVTAMAEALEARPTQFDYVHLSNILDWLSPDEARRTLRLAWNALRPGGWTLIRQLNSTLDIRALGEQFAWDEQVGNDLLRRDRSFFYRCLHLGRKE